MGVLHRDLKPANIMIDGRGRVRITDFGLASFAAEARDSDARAGTPAYMAPEQLAGRSPTMQSDIYALGLILFELFCGKRYFEVVGAQSSRTDPDDGTTSDLLRRSASDVDPDVARLIERCLAFDPARRPRTAMEVALALPGGDPLAAALAAGETPSPEAVANAGQVGTMHPAAAAACMAAMILAVVALIVWEDTLIKRLQPDKPPQVLADRAKQVLEKVGHTAAARDTAYGWGMWSWYLQYIRRNDPSPQRWDRLATARPSPLGFWYRESPLPLIPRAPVGLTAYYDPPFELSGMANVFLDHKGRLIELLVNPPELDADAPSEPATPPDWAALFREAGFDISQFAGAAPQWTPNHYCDTRLAWTGTYPGQPQDAIRIEAGGYRGKPVWFSVIDGRYSIPLRTKEAPQTTGQKAASWFGAVLVVSVFLAGALLARHNLKLQRGDRAGAARLFGVFLSLILLSCLLTTAHVAGLDELLRIMSAMMFSLFLAAMLWLLYLALEPYVRRRWPQILIAWGRLFAGRWRDPLVGRAILLGGLVEAVVVAMREFLEPVLVRAAGGGPAIPSTWTPSALLGARDEIAALVSPFGLIGALAILLVLFVLRVMLRRPWLAATAMVVLWVAPRALQGWANGDRAGAIAAVGVGVLHGALAIFLLTRFGLLAVAFAMYFDQVMYNAGHLDLSAWYAAGPLMAWVVLIVLMAFGYQTATSGRAWAREDLLA